MSAMQSQRDLLRRWTVIIDKRREPVESIERDVNKPVCLHSFVYIARHARLACASYIVRPCELSESDLHYHKSTKPSGTAMSTL